MRLLRYVLTAVLLVILGVAIYQTALWLRGGVNFTEPRVKPLDGDDQEVALIEPATSGDDWGRLVTALQLLERDWPKVNPNGSALHVDLADAFPSLTSDVPEVAFSFGDSPVKLRLRWYKISGEHTMKSWVRKLRARRRQPLAVIGGGTSDRAIKLAYTLGSSYGQNHEQPAPVLLLTTATAEKTHMGHLLIELYKGRTFRFAFTNPKMVEALFRFVENRRFPAEEREWAQHLWPSRPTEAPAMIQGIIAVAGAADPWHACAALSTQPALQPYTMYTVSWQDERYSQDMAEPLKSGFERRFPYGEFSPEWPIPYSLGGFFHAAPQEQAVVDAFLSRPTPLQPHSFMALPTGTVRMRRFLLNLRQRSPADARNLVILNGDAISFTSVYRDRESIWNILDLPYSLVFFSHRNPIDHAAGFTWARDDGRVDAVPQQTTTGTQDVLLYRDVFEALLYAAAQDGRVLDDPGIVRTRLRATTWNGRVGNRLVHSGNDRPFFDADGERQTNTGERIVWVKPSFTDDRVNLTSKISVWAAAPGVGGGWQLLEAHNATYNQSRLEEAP